MSQISTSKDRNVGVIGRKTKDLHLYETRDGTDEENEGLKLELKEK